MDQTFQKSHDRVALTKQENTTEGDKLRYVHWGSANNSFKLCMVKESKFYPYDFIKYHNVQFYLYCKTANREGQSSTYIRYLMYLHNHIQ